MKLQAVLFDVDGTLSETERDGHRVAFNMAFKETGVPWNWDEELYGKLLAVTGGKERMHYYVEHFLKEDPTKYAEKIPALHKVKTKHYVGLMESGRIPLRPGVHRLLDEIKKAGIKIAVVTTTTPENVTALIHGTLGPSGMEYFDLVAAGDIVPQKKPSPDIYHYALEQLKLKPEETIAIEDSDNGLKSSLGAGVKTIVTVNGYTENQDFSGAALVLSDLGEPAKPARVINGSNFQKPFVDLELLQKIHAE